MPDHDLELALAGCGRELVFPPTPDLRAAVARRLEPARRPRRRVLVLALAVLLATAGVAAGVTAGLHGLGIAFVDRVPPVTPGKGLALGLRVHGDEARRLAGFRVIVPGTPLGAPGAWYVGNAGDARVVTLVWGAARTLPAPRNGVSVLATESPGSIEPVYMRKFVGPDSTIAPVDVDGHRGLWISGAPHAISWSDHGEFRNQEIRLAGDVLVWNQGGLLLRIEGARSLAEARRLARSFTIQGTS